MTNERPALSFTASSQSLIAPYLPGTSDGHDQSTPFVTLTYAQSLDGAITLSPGMRTVLSGPETKAMTHFLRSQHDAIIVGATTAISDDPSLNCRIAGVKLGDQPRPVIIDPDRKWNVANSTCLRLAKQGSGRAPMVIVADCDDALVYQETEIEAQYVVVPRETITTPTSSVTEMPWASILKMLKQQGYRSVMIEGGATVITGLLRPDNIYLVDSVVVTIAPIWLGQGSLTVSPERRIEGGQLKSALRLRDTKWYQFGEDVVMCGRTIVE